MFIIKAVVKSAYIRDIQKKKCKYKVHIISKYGVNMAYISVFKVYEGHVYVYNAYIRISDIMCIYGVYN